MNWPLSRKTFDSRLHTENVARTTTIQTKMETNIQLINTSVVQSGRSRADFCIMSYSFFFQEAKKTNRPGIDRSWKFATCNKYPAQSLWNKPETKWSSAVVERLVTCHEKVVGQNSCTHMVGTKHIGQFWTNLWTRESHPKQKPPPVLTYGDWLKGSECLLTLRTSLSDPFWATSSQQKSNPHKHVWSFLCSKT